MSEEDRIAALTQNLETLVDLRSSDAEDNWKIEIRERLARVETESRIISDAIREVRDHAATENQRKLTTVLDWMEKKEDTDKSQSMTIHYLLIGVIFLTVLCLLALGYILKDPFIAWLSGSIFVSDI